MPAIQRYLSLKKNVLNIQVGTMLALTLLSPCPARPGYIRFQAYFKPNNMSLKWTIQFVVDVQLVK